MQKNKIVFEKTLISNPGVPNLKGFHLGNTEASIDSHLVHTHQLVVWTAQRNFTHVKAFVLLPFPAAYNAMRSAQCN